MFSKTLFTALSVILLANPSVLGAPTSCPARSTITVTTAASSATDATDIAVTSSSESSASVETASVDTTSSAENITFAETSVAVPTSVPGGSKGENDSDDSSNSDNSGKGGKDSKDGKDGGNSLNTSACNTAATTSPESSDSATSTSSDSTDTITPAASTASSSTSADSKTCPVRSTVTVTASAASNAGGGSQNGSGSGNNNNSGSDKSDGDSDNSSTSTGCNAAAITSSANNDENGNGNGDGNGNGNNNGGEVTSDDDDANTTASATATSTSGSGSGSGNNAADDQQSATTLNPAVIATGFALDGQETPAAGQVASLTSRNNFINFCLTVDKPITNGQQIKTGSCNPAPMGVIAAITNMPSSKFVNPKNFDTIQANQAFTIQMAINNIETGNFVNAQNNYYSAPQQVNDQGNIIGHTHVVIEQLDSLNQTTPTDPTRFAFFKGINGAAVNGIVTADVADGLPAGAYRMASINSAANHQPVLVAVAQHGSLDDMVYFTVE